MTEDSWLPGPFGRPGSGRPQSRAADRHLPPDLGPGKSRVSVVAQEQQCVSLSVGEKPVANRGRNQVQVVVPIDVRCGNILRPNADPEFDVERVAKLTLSVVYQNGQAAGP